MAELLAYSVPVGGSLRLGQFRAQRMSSDGERADHLLVGHRRFRGGGIANVATVLWGGPLLVETSHRWFGPHWRRGNALCWVWGRTVVRYVTVVGPRMATEPYRGGKV